MAGSEEDETAAPDALARPSSLKIEVLCWRCRSLPGSRRHKASEDDIDLSKPVDLVVLAVKERAARCRLLGTERVITLRAGSLHRVVAGQIATVQPNKQWRHVGHPYLSGKIVGARIDISEEARDLRVLRPVLTSDVRVSE